MTALDIFTYEGQMVRTEIFEGEPYFVLADLCAVLDLRNVKDVKDRIDPDGVGQTYLTDSLGRQQLTTIVSEACMYEVVIRSDKPKAVAFRRWITTAVLPSIRKTGAYVTPTSELDQIKALHAAVGSLLAQNAIDAPKVAAWDELASASGDYEVADAAKILARAGIETGRQRLFDQLRDLNWIHRGTHGKWKAYQSAVDAGYLAEKPTSHFHPKTGEVVLDPPQVRVTVKGLERLRVRLGELVLA